MLAESSSSSPRGFFSQRAIRSVQQRHVRVKARYGSRHLHPTLLSHHRCIVQKEKERLMTEGMQW